MSSSRTHRFTGAVPRSHGELGAAELRRDAREAGVQELPRGGAEAEARAAVREHAVPRGRREIRGETYYVNGCLHVLATSGVWRLDTH